MEEAPGVVFVVMRGAMGGGAYRGVRKAGVEGQSELTRVERRNGPGRGRNRRSSVMRWVGLHIEAKRGRGQLRDGGVSKENMCFFPVKGSRGQRVQSVYTLGEFWVPDLT